MAVREVLLTASESRWMRVHLSRSRLARRAARRFLPGEELDDALRAAGDLARDGMQAVISHLGEDAGDTDEAELAAAEVERAIRSMATSGMLPHVSVKPTQLGLHLDTGCAEQLASRLAALAASWNGVLWLDMESTALTDATIQLYRSLARHNPDIGLCLQAYLRRTARDLAGLLPLRPRIRLVKGAYREPPALAFQDPADVNAAYLELAVTLLRQGGAPALGTHDLALVARIESAAAELGVDGQALEVQMLYGVRPREQRRLAAGGRPVRVLISYGTEWFAWYVRRLAERPANLVFALRAVLGP